MKAIFNNISFRIILVDRDGHTCTITTPEGFNGIDVTRYVSISDVVFWENNGEYHKHNLKEYLKTKRIC